METRERQQDAAAEARERSAHTLALEFIAALRGDLSAPALFAPRVTDWSTRHDTKSPRPMRFQSGGEVVMDQLTGTPQFNAMVNLLADMAYGTDDRSVMAHKARHLINTIAYAFGDNNVEES